MLSSHSVADPVVHLKLSTSPLAKTSRSTPVTRLLLPDRFVLCPLSCTVVTIRSVWRCMQHDFFSSISLRYPYLIVPHDCTICSSVFSVGKGPIYICNDGWLNQMLISVFSVGNRPIYIIDLLRTSSWFSYRRRLQTTPTAALAT